MTYDILAIILLGLAVLVFVGAAVLGKRERTRARRQLLDEMKEKKDEQHS